MATESPMRAVRFHEYGPPSVLVVDEIDRPEPRAGEVLIRVHAAGVNPIDWKTLQGLMAEEIPLQLPAGLGSDVAGVVDQVGEGVTDLTERGVDLAGQALHARNRSKCDQCNHKSILNQILAVLLQKNLQFDAQLVKSCVHECSPFHDLRVEESLK